MEEVHLSDEDINEFLEERNTTPVEEDSSFIIKPLSPTLFKKRETERFSSASWYKNISNINILLAGVGGIGSWVALLLSRTNVGSITLYDDDIVDIANLAGQFYSNAYTGQYKVYAISDQISLYSNYVRVNTVKSKITAWNTSNHKVMICGFDNMEARNTLYKIWKNNVINAENKNEYLFIDGRLAAEEFQIFTISGEDDFYMKEYESNWLFSDIEAEETLCSYKQTSYMACMIASQIVNILVNFVANSCGGYREVPFKTTYVGDIMNLKLEK